MPAPRERIWLSKVVLTHEPHSNLEGLGDLSGGLNIASPDQLVLLERALAISAAPRGLVKEPL